jgi:hypothetical protein
MIATAIMISSRVNARSRCTVEVTLPPRNHNTRQRERRG